MSRTSKNLSPDELLKQIEQLPFEERFQLWEQVKTNVQKEALDMKQKGEKASKILETITNGD